MQEVYKRAYLLASRLRNSVEFLLEGETSCNTVRLLYTRFSNVRNFCQKRFRTTKKRRKKSAAAVLSTTNFEERK